MYRATADIANWSDRMRSSLQAIYGDALQSMWTGITSHCYLLSWINQFIRRRYNVCVFACALEWLNAMEDIYSNKGGNICMEFLPDVKCKTLVVHGRKVCLCTYSCFVHQIHTRDGIQLYVTTLSSDRTRWCQNSMRIITMKD